MHSDVPCRWLRKAEKDVRAAMKLLDEPDYSAFHSQQAAEKALKALLVALGERPPRTHNIGLLLDRLKGHGFDTSPIHKARILTDYAVEARYPDFEEIVTLDEAKEALELARAVIRWAREQLSHLGVSC